MLNLSEAAKVSGQPKSAIWRAVNSGQLPATRTFAGDYRIDPAELHRVFPPGAELATDVSPIVSLKRDPTELQRAEAASMQEQIERLFEVGRQIRKELDDAATPSTPPLAPATRPVRDDGEAVSGVSGHQRVGAQVSRQPDPRQRGDGRAARTAQPPPGGEVA